VRFVLLCRASPLIHWRNQTYGFTKKTPQGKNQPAQTAQEVAHASSQEAHLAEVKRPLPHFSVVCSRGCPKQPE
jgi:hypothetical protein